MRFEQPYFLLALLLLPLLAWLYVRRAGKREAAVPSLSLWKAAAEEASAEAGRRLGALDLSLVLALLFFATVILAASGPVLLGPKSGAPNLLVIADRSASMATGIGLVVTSDGLDSGSRWSRDVRELESALSEARGGRVQLLCLPLAAGPGLREMTPPEAVAALRKLEPTDMPLDMAEELSRCAGLAAGVSGVVVLTDNPKVVPETLGGKPVFVISSGEPSHNIAIDAFEVSRTDGELAVFTAVKNYSAWSSAVPLQVLTDGKVVEEIKLDLGPGARATFDSTKPLGTASEIEVRLAGLGRISPSPGEPGKWEEIEVGNLASDNSAVAVRSGEGAIRVAYVGRGNPFIVRALELLPGVRLSQFRLTGDVGPGYDLYIYDGVTPPALPKGDVVLIDPRGQAGPLKISEAASDAADGRVTLAQATAPDVLRDVDVGALRFKKTLKIEGPASARALLRSANGEGVVLLRWEDAATRLTVIGSGLVLSETNWPMLPSFPIFWSNVIEEVAGRRNAAEAVPSFWLTGDRVPVRSVAGEEPKVVDPLGRPVTLMPGQGARSYFLAERAGIYKATSGGVKTEYAVNMLHARESDNAGAPGQAVSDFAGFALELTGTPGILLRRYATALALILALAYWASASRIRR